ncbi:MAG: arsenite methyltransferase [Nitrospirae bacterium]|nr:arsenite methyltransferase [Nitrospirota bacterium]
MRELQLKKMVRNSYAKIVMRKGSCCGNTAVANDISKSVGYSENELNIIPEGANLGLGCGNPVALASLKEGETVLDLGSGAGVDCFLAAERIGKNGKVIGVDMTPEMIEKARENAEKGSYKNVEFRLGEIENLPAADNSVDVIISNCVINLVPDKRRAFQEAYRALKPGGRLMISDIVLLKKLPDAIKASVEAYIGCVSGAILKNEYLEAIKAAGFQDIRIINETVFPIEFLNNDPIAKSIIEDIKISSEEAKETASSVVSIKVCGVKRGV